MRFDTSNKIYEMQRWDGARIQAVGDSGGPCFDGSGRVVGIQSTAWFQSGVLAQTFQAKASYVRSWVNANVFFQQEKELTTLNTTPGQMTLFRQDGAGHVWFRNFTSGAPGTPTNWNGWVRIGDDWSAFPPQKIAAASRNTAHQDIFLRGYDNKIWTTYRDNLGAWVPWFIVNNLPRYVRE